jgi:hypothetical protein
MARRIRITGIPRKTPEIGLYVQALIALARQMQEQGRGKETKAPETTTTEEAADDR